MSVFGRGRVKCQRFVIAVGCEGMLYSVTNMQQLSRRVLGESAPSKAVDYRLIFQVIIRKLYWCHNWCQPLLGSYL